MTYKVCVEFKENMSNVLSSICDKGLVTKNRSCQASQIISIQTELYTHY